VRLRDRAHDGEPEPGARAAASDVTARKAVEGTRREISLEAWTCIRHSELHALAVPP
jgi:hypothetical protein